MAATITGDEAYKDVAAFFISPLVSISSPACLQFSYFVSTTLHLLLVGENQYDHYLAVRKSQGLSWHSVSINLPAGTYHLYFKTNYPYSYSVRNIDIPQVRYMAALDDVELSDGPCPGDSE